jgi:hypothetical protein
MAGGGLKDPINSQAGGRTPEIIQKSVCAYSTVYGWRRIVEPSAALRRVPRPTRPRRWQGPQYVRLDGDTLTVSSKPAKDRGRYRALTWLGCVLAVVLVLYITLFEFAGFADESQTRQSMPFGYVIAGVALLAAVGVLALALRRRHGEDSRSVLRTALVLVASLAVPAGIALLTIELI